MGNSVIVAIPREDDPIWKISSEKVPHLTFLFLGPSENVDVPQVALFLEHAAKLSLTRFGLDVDRRGTLGPDNADVLFFQDNWELPHIREFRDLLLKDTNIRKAYDSVQQYGVIQEWTPHLTLGYPTSPAKKSDGPIYWVQFDRVAIWTGDYSGPEFQLEDNQYAEVAMTDQSAAGRQFLAHHGVLGMKWGHRKEQAVTSKAGSTIIRKQAKVDTAGGHAVPAHSDAIQVAEHRRVLAKSGMAALSNDQLKVMQERLQLESNVSRLHNERSSKGKQQIRKMTGDFTKQVGQEVVNETVRSAVKKGKFKKKV